MQKQQYFSNDDFYLLRKHIKFMHNKAINQIKNSNNPLNILEIGPALDVHYEEFDVSSKKDSFKKTNHKYQTLDLQGSHDFIGSIEDIDLPAENFDLIIALSVLEHVNSLESAANNLSRITKVGGKVYLQTPFLFKVHGPIPDNWRISEYGYKALFSDNFYIEMDSLPKDEFGKNSKALSYGAILTKK